MDSNNNNLWLDGKLGQLFVIRNTENGIRPHPVCGGIILKSASPHKALSIPAKMQKNGPRDRVLN